MTTLNTNTLAQVQISQVIEQLKQDESLLLETYSEYASNNGYNSVDENDEDNINMLFANSHDAIRSAFYGDYNPSHAYFTFNGYGNLQSFEYLDDDNSPIDIEELAQWIVDNELYNDYDIEVTTLEDMLSAIEDNITDDIDMLYKLCDYLAITYNDSNDTENLIGDCMYKLDGTVTDETQGIYEKLVDVINHLNIDY